MVEIADIVDRESLEAWLEDQPKEVSVWIAWRAAMRVLPYYWQWTVTSKDAREGDLATLPFLRFYLISEVARIMPTSEIIASTLASAHEASTATATATSAEAATASSSASFAAVAFVASTATSAEASAFVYDFAAVAANAATAFATSATSTAIWNSIRADCKAIAEGDDLDGLELWAASENPLVGVWTSLKVRLLVHSSSRSEETARDPAPVDWSFWIKWYDSVLAGEPLIGDMLQEIALIEPAEWDHGGGGAGEFPDWGD